MVVHSMDRLPIGPNPALVRATGHRPPDPAPFYGDPGTVREGSRGMARQGSHTAKSVSFVAGRLAARRR